MSDDFDKIAELTRNGYSIDEALNQIAQSVADGAVTADKVDTTTLSPVVQIVRTDDGEVTTGTTLFVYDDTIPQNDEGAEFITVTITPKDAENKLIVEGKLHFANSNTTNSIFAALFKDSDADAIATSFGSRNNIANTVVEVGINHTLTAGTTSSITFKIRAGSNLAGTVTFNGASGSRLFGGTLASYIQVTEVLQ